MERAQGFAMQGARVVWTHGLSSQTVVQETAPLATITVYITGTTTLATLYSDNQVPPTHMANPFTANYNGYWFFYAQDGRYDVMIECPEWTWTIGDLLLQDPGRWTADQNANGHWLHNLGGISFVNNLNPMCASPQMWMDQNCNLLITGGQGEVLWSLAPNGDMRIAGCLTTQCIHLNNGTCSTTIGFDPSCNVIVTGQSGNRLATLDQSGNLTLSGCLTAPCIHLNNGPCQSTITFDAGCRVEITGAGLSVDGYLNVVGGAQIDGPFAINGPLSADINANGHSITNLGVIETQGIQFNNGTCQAEMQFDANCNLTVYGNLKANDNFTVGGSLNVTGSGNFGGSLNAGSINVGGSPLDTGVISVNGLKGEVTLLAGQGIDVTATSQNITISARASYPGITELAVVTTQRSFNTVYQNSTTVPMFVSISVNLGPNDGAIATVGQTSPPAIQVGVIESVSQDFTLIMQLSFWVLPGWYYLLDNTLSFNPDWPPLINKWMEWT